MIRCALALAFLIVPAGAAQAPALSPDAFMRALSSIGFKIGAVRTIEQVTVRVDGLRVESDGKWLVIRVLPTRVPPPYIEP